MDVEKYNNRTKFLKAVHWHPDFQIVRLFDDYSTLSVGVFVLRNCSHCSRYSIYGKSYASSGNKTEKW